MNIFCTSLILWVGIIVADNVTDKEELRLIRELAQRVNRLELREKVHAQTILEHEMREEIYIERLTDLESHNVKQEAELQSLKEKFEAIDVDESKILSTRIEDIRQQRDTRLLRQAEIESPIAFFATLGSHFQQAGVNQTFVFEQIVTNVGGAYDKNVGLFTAPFSGIYVFSTTLVSWNEISAHASFFKNDHPINIMFVSGRVGAADTTSATIILELQKGDDVTVRNGADGGVSYYGANHSLFSGFLLHESFSSPGNIIGK